MVLKLQGNEDLLHIFKGWKTHRGMMALLKWQWPIEKEESETMRHHSDIKRYGGAFLLSIMLLLTSCNAGGGNGGGSDEQASTDSTPTYTVSGDVYVLNVYGQEYDITSTYCEDRGGYCSIEISNLSGDNPLALQTTIDENGHYAFTDIPNGTYTLSLDAWMPIWGSKGASIRYYYTVVVNDADVIQDIDFKSGSWG